MRHTLARIALVLSWLGTAAAGMAMLSAYANTPGTPASPPPEWPATSSIALRVGTPTVLVFAHPNCPCTRATLDEIDWILARVAGRADVHVLLLQPASVDPTWADHGLEQLAASIPTVQVHWDLGGEEAMRFGVATSGEVLLYDAAARLRFAGGVTAGRAHEGANAGRDELLAQLTAASGDVGTSPVFGCGLWNPPTT
jgi:hypothetical protein